jgi:hypothetical protein
VWVGALRVLLDVNPGLFRTVRSRVLATPMTATLR